MLRFYDTRPRILNLTCNFKSVIVNNLDIINNLFRNVILKFYFASHCAHFTLYLLRTSFTSLRTLFTSHSIHLALHFIHFTLRSLHFTLHLLCTALTSIHALFTSHSIHFNSRFIYFTLDLLHAWFASHLICFILDLLHLNFSEISFFKNLIHCDEYSDNITGVISFFSMYLILFFNVFFHCFLKSQWRNINKIQNAR